MRSISFLRSGKTESAGDIRYVKPMQIFESPVKISCHNILNSVYSIFVSGKSPRCFKWHIFK